jgi:hypothetical protein
MTVTRCSAMRIVVSCLVVAAFAAEGLAQGYGAAGTMRAAGITTLAAYAGIAVSDSQPVKCGLPLISLAHRNLRELPARETQAIQLLDARPALQTSLSAGAFRFHFDTTGNDAPALLNALHQRIPGSARAFVDSAAAIMAYTASYEIDSLGYLPPPQDGTLGGGPEYDIYIMDLGALYGYTSPDVATPEGGTSTTFVTIDNDFIFVQPDSNKGMPGLKVTLAHEFHHAIQIGRYGYRPSDVWYHEVTSVWMEDVVFTGVNDYYQYLFATWSHFRNPETAFTSNQIIEYSRGIWGQYFTKKFGGDAMLRTWQGIGAAPPVTAIDNVLRSRYQSNLRAAFGEWSLWNYFTAARANATAYYPEGGNFPLMAETMYDVAADRRDITGAVGCLSSKYFRVASGRDTLALIITYTGNGCTTGGSTVPFTLTVARAKLDDSFRSASSGYFLKLSVADLSQWVMWDIGPGGVIGGPFVAVGGAFPNPFVAGKAPFVYLRSALAEGTVSVFTSDMVLVYTEHQVARSYLGQSVFVWDGKTLSGSDAHSGIYIFVVHGESGSVTGKIALVR